MIVLACFTWNLDGKQIYIPKRSFLKRLFSLMFKVLYDKPWLVLICSCKSQINLHLISGSWPPVLYFNPYKVLYMIHSDFLKIVNINVSTHLKWLFSSDDESFTKKSGHAILSSLSPTPQHSVFLLRPCSSWKFLRKQGPKGNM